ncbi:hypothetical protein CLOM_g17695, partial [Closterium sp. NIES-68]
LSSSVLLLLVDLDLVDAPWGHLERLTKPRFLRTPPALFCTECCCRNPVCSLPTLSAALAAAAAVPAFAPAPAPAPVPASAAQCCAFM